MLLIRPVTDRPPWPRLGRRPELRLLDLLEEHCQRAVEDRAGITVGDLPAQERLQASQLLVALVADGELHPVTLRR